MKTLIAVVMLSSLAIPSRAEEAKKSSWGDFFKNLRSSLSQSAVSGERKKGRNAQGVAAVRGSEQDKKNIADPDEPGLKGDAKSARLKRERARDAELEAAVALIDKGQLDEALAKLAAFQEAYPRHRVEDVSKAIEGVKALKAEKASAPAE